MNLKICKTLLALLFISLAHFAQAGSVRLNNSVDHFNITPQLEYIEDVNHRFNPFSIMFKRNFGLWKNVQNDFVNFGYSDSIYWFRVELDASQSPAKSWNLVFSNPLIEFIDVYHVTDTGPRIIYSSGSGRPFKRRQFDHHKMIVPVDIYEPTTLLIRTSSNLDNSFQIKAWKNQSFWQALQLSDNLNWLYYGLLLTMILYNLFLFITIIDRSYLFYVIYITSYGLYLMMLDGYLFQHLWPSSEPFNFATLQMTIHVAIIFGLLFSIHFLKVKVYSKTLTQIMYLFFGLSIFSFGLFPVLTTIEMAYIQLALATIAMLLNTWVGAYCAIKGYRPAVYFVIGWACFAIGNFILLGAKLGYLPFTELTNLAAKLGSAIEALLLSFALGHRIRLLKVESETEKLRADTRSQFLAQMSHEIRTPLNGVLGISQILRETQLSHQQREYIDTISASGQALLGLINDILDHSKIEAGKMAMDKYAFDVIELTEQIKKVFLHFEKQKNIPLILEVDENVPRIIYGDQNRLRQILINLVGNAFKFSQQGEIKLALKQENIKAINYMRFEVTDQGIGIAPQDKERLFESYIQANATTTRKFGGTGLGLSISKQLVELMNGQIDVHSQFGKGSTFWFRIPLEEAQFDKLANVQAPIKPHQNSYNILVAEDNKVNQMVVRGLLKRLGHEVYIVENGVEAVDYYIENGEPLDLILMDCEMPELDGFEATEKIRKYEQQSNMASTTIIALTAHATAEHRQRAMDSGMDDFLCKPVQYQDLFNTIESIDAYKEE